MASGRRWRALMTFSPRQALAELRLRRAAALIRRSGLFDAAWYRGNYPDVAASGFDPLRHYLRTGAAEGRDPGPRFVTRAYLDRNPDVARAGLNPLLHYLRHGAKEGRGADAAELARARVRGAGLVPLRGFRAPSAGPSRVTLLTDSLGPESLFGGVATAILFATLLAERHGAVLRIVTETRPPLPDAAAAVLRAHGIAPPANIATEFADRRSGDARDIDIGDAEMFVTTAWWNTANLLQAVAPRRIVHMLQEDERMFYPHGDLHLMCAEHLATPGLRFAVNTRLLCEHMQQDGLAREAAWFEPAFPTASYHWQDRAPDARRRCIFYARPGHPRNLYLRGLEVISTAIERGVFDLDRWDIAFVGRDLNESRLPRGVQPTLHQGLSWSDYAALMRQTDLGLCLMYTPHPSYPPLDLAACGGVAVTNRYGRKRALDHYSANVICADADVESLVAALADGVRLAEDDAARRRNYDAAGLNRDWQAAFRPVLDRIAAG